MLDLICACSCSAVLPTKFSLNPENACIFCAYALVIAEFKPIVEVSEVIGFVSNVAR